MKQLVFGFASEEEVASPVRLDPKIQERLVTLMAQVVLSVMADVRAAEVGGSDEADAVEPQDHAAAPRT